MRTNAGKNKIMTMLMMERIIANNHKVTQEPLDKERSLHPAEPQIFLQPKRISDDSRDVEMCEKSDEDVDVENDDALCPVDLTRRHETFSSSFESPITVSPNSEFNSYKDDVKRAESVCSDQSRSRSPITTDGSPSTGSVTVQNRRLAFSVENILDPNKFTGRQSGCGDDVCCWKQLDGGRRSPEFDESDTGMFVVFLTHWIP